MILSCSNAFCGVPGSWGKRREPSAALTRSRRWWAAGRSGEARKALRVSLSCSCAMSVAVDSKPTSWCVIFDGEAGGEGNELCTISAVGYSKLTSRCEVVGEDEDRAAGEGIRNESCSVSPILAEIVNGRFVRDRK